MRAGAARLIPEPELSGERLAREILALIDDPREAYRTRRARAQSWRGPMPPRRSWI